MSVGGKPYILVKLRSGQAGVVAMACAIEELLHRLEGERTPQQCQGVPHTSPTEPDYTKPDLSLPSQSRTQTVARVQSTSTEAVTMKVADLT